MTQKNATPTPKVARRPRWGARVGITLGVLLFLGMLALGVTWFVTRPSFIIARVQPVLARLLGGDVTIGDARYRGGGRFVFGDMVLRAPGTEGPGGEVCRVNRALVELDLGALLGGDVVVRSIELSGARLRLSESAREPGEFSFAALTPDWSMETVRSGVLPPEVRLETVVVELGVYDGAAYDRRGARALSGTMRPQAGADGIYELTLIEVDAEGLPLGEGGVKVDGTWNVATNEHRVRLEELELDERAYDLCPQIAQLWWDRMDLAGRVRNVELHWSEDEGLRVGFDIKDVGLTLPIETSELLARYRDGRIEASGGRPRMRVDSGSIFLSPRQVRLDRLEGELIAAGDGEAVVGLPYAVSVTIDDLPDIEWSDRQQWMDHALESAPFGMSLQANQFRIVRDEAGRMPAVVFPLAVARVLQKFHFSEGMLSTDVSISRAPPAVTPGAAPVAQPVRSQGRTYITQAVGRYEKFPYPLTDVSAYLEFDNDAVVVHYLTGKGSEGANVRVSGTIAPPGPEAAVELHLLAADAPVDDALRGALSEAQQEAYDALLHRPSRAALAEAGLLVDDAAFADLAAEVRAERRALAAEQRRLDEAGPDAPADARAALHLREAALERRERLAEAGPFRLGGRVDLDLWIRRPLGLGERTVVTGLMTFARAGVLYDRFPYPLTMGSGVIDWREDRVVLRAQQGDEGIPVVTPGGGEGRLEGAIELPREGGEIRMRPDLTLRVRGDTINPLLIAAIPPTPSEREDSEQASGWPGGALSRAGRWLEDAELTASLDYEAHITSDEERWFNFNALIELADGRARPGPLISDFLGAESPPAGGREWVIEDLHGQLAITPESVELRSLAGRCGGGELTVHGAVDLDRQPFDLTLDARMAGLSVGEQVLSVLPESARPRAEALLERYRPSGRFDARLACHVRGEEVEALQLAVEPRDIEIAVGGQTVTLVREGGVMRLGKGRLHFDDLALHLRRGDEDDGVLRLGGAIALAPLPDGSGPVLEGRWEGGRFESPVLSEAVRRLGGEERAGPWEALRPRGVFDASFSFAAAPPGETAAHRVEVHPREAAIDRAGGTLDVSFDEPSRFVIEPGRLILDQVTCREDGDVLRADGMVVTEPALDASLDLEYHGRLGETPFRVLLPEIARDALDAIKLGGERPGALTGGKLHVAGRPGAAPDDAVAVEFSGRLDAADASLVAGLEFSDITGPFDVHVRTAPDQPADLLVRARPERAVVLGQRLTGIEADVTLSEDGKRVLVRDFRADAGAGLATAEADVGIGHGAPYRVTADLTSVPLGDFALRPRVAAAAAEQPDEPVSNTTLGLLFASIDLAGRFGEPDAATGRGVVRVMGGKLAEIPLALQLMRVASLTVPGGSWDYADTEFFIAGDTLYFERILFESTFFSDKPRPWLVQDLRGTGELDLDTFELSARFHTRGSLLIVRDVVAGVGNQLADIEVTGPLWDPAARLAPPQPSPSGEPLAAAPPVVNMEE